VEADLLDVLEEVAAQEGGDGRLVVVGGEEVEHTDGMEAALASWRGEGHGDGGLVRFEEVLGEEALGGDALGCRATGGARAQHQAGAVREGDVQGSSRGECRCRWRTLLRNVVRLR
jgi:hypothetical protein